MARLAAHDDRRHPHREYFQEDRKEQVPPDEANGWVQVHSKVGVYYDGKEYLAPVVEFNDRNIGWTEVLVRLELDLGRDEEVWVQFSDCFNPPDSWDT